MVNERADQLAKAATKASPSSDLTSLALTGIKIKDATRLEWIKVLNEYKHKAVELNPNNYSKKYSWKIRKRLAISIGMKRELASTFY